MIRKIISLFKDSSKKLSRFRRLEKKKIINKIFKSKIKEAFKLSPQKCSKKDLFL